jgi:hypothetical protein
LLHNQTAVDQTDVTSAAVRGKRQIGAAHQFCSGRIVQFQLDRFKRAIEVGDCHRIGVDTFRGRCRLARVFSSQPPLTKQRQQQELKFRITLSQVCDPIDRPDSKKES